ncbi:TPA: Hcp family type VI secretion system effector [Providencia rettgeri]|uniref:Secreted protein hcp n=1 Tax=Pectobacterium carotovorum TaxID=554 RepID=A0A0N9NB87_PECCA|nr:Hcp family type VI secretion system effector [Pectobacterium carotovorum]ALG88515.1 Secreted protein hcp [Pectobacterium carotovorum]HEP0304271.1 Hcp family type VI secretion system effector [Providencia rettgeri]
MANQIYLTLEGKKQGLISSGCSSYDSIGNKFQANHENEIFVYSTTYSINRHQNVSHAPFTFTKLDDKSTPLLINCINDNELLNCDFSFYRTDNSGKLVIYKKIKLTNASIISITNHHPNALDSNDAQAYETISMRYESITCEHMTANTSSYSIPKSSNI